MKHQIINICFRKIALKVIPRFAFWEYVEDSATSTKMLKTWSATCAAGMRVRFQRFHAMFDKLGTKYL